MKNIWNKINYGIGILNLLTGIIVFYSIFKIAKRQYNSMIKFSEQNGLETFNESMWKLFFQNQTTIILLFLTISGILLLLRNKYGWIFGLSSWVVIALIFIPTAIYGISDVTITTMGHDHWIKIFSGIGLLVSIIFITTLLLKPIRIINKVNSISWLLSFGIILVLYYAVPIIL